MRLVRARAQDAGALQACLEACAGYFRAAEKRRVRTDEARALLAEAEVDRGRAVYLLVAGGRRAPLGVIDLVLDHPRPGEATVALLAVTPDARRRGVGSDAAATLFARLKSRGYRSVRLGVRRGAKGAAEFWAAVGMIEVERDGAVRQFVAAL